MIKIKKGLYIRKKLTTLFILITIFCTLLCYFLGWDFSLKSVLILLLIVVLEIFIFILIYLILYKVYYSEEYIITSQCISLYKKNKEIFSIDQKFIKSFTYVQFKWAFLQQLGSGYLIFEYLSDVKNLEPSLNTEEGNKFYAISMSQQQAVQVAKLLQREINIK